MRRKIINVNTGVNRVSDPYQVLGVSRDASDEEIKKHTGH